MKIPAIKGLIERRILINFQVDKHVIAGFLPKPFVPKLVQDKAIVGICLIRLKAVRPKGFSEAIGISSENGAHRISVEWLEEGKIREGVYIPRRDTSSRLNSFAGGRFFPGVHHLANFTVEENNGYYFVDFKSEDGTTLAIKAQETNVWNKESVFASLASASEFFQRGAVGYSPDKSGCRFDGLELKTEKWEVFPLKVTQVQSSFFEDDIIFPKGTVKFDNALLMRNIEHEWMGLKQIGDTRPTNVFN